MFYLLPSLSTIPSKNPLKNSLASIGVAPPLPLPPPAPSPLFADVTLPNLLPLPRVAEGGNSSFLKGGGPIPPATAGVPNMNGEIGVPGLFVVGVLELAFRLNRSRRRLC
jgi:hypothetical protein